MSYNTRVTNVVAAIAGEVAYAGTLANRGIEFGQETTANVGEPNVSWGDASVADKEAAMNDLIATVVKRFGSENSLLGVFIHAFTTTNGQPDGYDRLIGFTGSAALTDTDGDGMPDAWEVCPTSLPSLTSPRSTMVSTFGSMTAPTTRTATSSQT